jgi:PadR family transcriptional regulator PadR
VQQATSGASSGEGRFAFAPPRHFVLPAVLLLLSEEPSYGYQLVKGLRAFRFGDVDRPAVYRALAQLEKDRLVQSWSAESKAGQARRVYGLTEDGERALRTWMGVVKEERDGLDRVLRRYLSSGTPDALLAEATVGWNAFSGQASAGFREDADPTAVTLLRDYATPAERDQHPSVALTAQGVQRFRVVPERSAVLIEARSTVGPITFGMIGITGSIETVMRDGQIEPGEHTRAHLEIAFERLSSGNRLYDAELLRRIDARRYPVATLELHEVNPIGAAERFALDGSITFHGDTRNLQGTVVAGLPSARTLVVRGEHGFDIRDFDISSPTVLMFRIYPDVMVKLQLEAVLED